MTGLTIIVPTIGRPSRLETLTSLRDQVQRGDEVILVSDTKDYPPFKEERGVFGNKSKARWTNECTGDDAPLGAYGHAARNRILDRYQDCFFYAWSLDDDDIAAPGALAAIRTAIDSFPGAWFIFQMVGGENSHYSALKVPTVGHQIRVGNVGTPCIVWPASAEARWGMAGDSEPYGKMHMPDGYFGDYEMAVALQAELGDPIWVDEVLAVIRP